MDIAAALLRITEIQREIDEMRALFGSSVHPAAASRPILVPLAETDAHRGLSKEDVEDRLNIARVVINYHDLTDADKHHLRDLLLKTYRKFTLKGNHRKYGLNVGINHFSRRIGSQSPDLQDRSFPKDRATRVQ